MCGHNGKTSLPFINNQKIGLQQLFSDIEKQEVQDYDPGEKENKNDEPSHKPNFLPGMRGTFQPSGVMSDLPQ